MAFSQVDICNLALSRAGGHSISQITSLGEASTEARQCAVKFPYVLRSVLRSYPWRFAAREIALALIAHSTGNTGNADRAENGHAAAVHGGEALYSYQYPDECLQILAINPAGSKKGNYHGTSHDYVVERIDDGTKIIVTSCPHAVLTYTSQADDPSIWDSLFTDAFAWQLAAELCMGLGGDYGRVEALQKMANMAFDKARTQDCKESSSFVGQSAPYRGLVHSHYLEARK